MLHELDILGIILLGVLLLIVCFFIVILIAGALLVIRPLEPLARLRSRRGTYRVTSATKTRDNDNTTYRIVIIEDGTHLPLDMARVPWERTEAMLNLNPGGAVYLDMNVDRKTLSVTRVHGYDVSPASLDNTTP